jgi:hypothetical protein
MGHTTSKTHLMNEVIIKSIHAIHASTPSPIHWHSYSQAQQSPPTPQVHNLIVIHVPNGAMIIF